VAYFVVVAGVSDADGELVDPPTDVRYLLLTQRTLLFQMICAMPFFTVPVTSKIVPLGASPSDVKLEVDVVRIIRTVVPRFCPVTLGSDELVDGLLCVR